MSSSLLKVLLNFSNKLKLKLVSFWKRKERKGKSRLMSCKLDFDSLNKNILIY